MQLDKEALDRLADDEHLWQLLHVRNEADLKRYELTAKVEEKIRAQCGGNARLANSLCEHYRAKQRQEVTEETHMIANHNIAKDDLSLTLEYLVPELKMGPGRPAVLVGVGGTNKTWLAMDLGLACAYGQSWLNMNVEPGSVAHLDYEMSSKDVRIRYLRLKHGRQLLDVPSTHALEYVKPRVRLDAPDAENYIGRLMAGRKLMIIDNLRAGQSMDENDSMIRIVLDMLGRLSNETGCTCMVIAHAGKPNADTAKKDKRFRARGSSAILDAASNLFVVEREHVGAGRYVYTLTDEKRAQGGSFHGLRYELQDVGEQRAQWYNTEGIRLAPCKDAAIPIDTLEDDFLSLIPENDWIKLPNIRKELKAKGHRFGEGRFYEVPKALVAAEKVETRTGKQGVTELRRKG